MKKLFALVFFVLIGCEPRGIESISVGIVWKAQTVKENGQLVFDAVNPNSIKPGYTKFRIDLTSKEMALYTDLDGRKLTGNWKMAGENKRLILTNLIPPPSETAGNIEFDVNEIITKRKLTLKRTSESRKTGKTINEYELIPE